MKKFVLPKIKQEENYLKILGPAGEIFEFIKTGQSTDGKYIISKTIVPSGAGPTPHFHHENDEWFYAPNGGIVLFVSKDESSSAVDNDGNIQYNKETLQAIDMYAGQLIYVPRKHFHAFVNNTNQPQLLYMIWTPDQGAHSILEYFKHVGQKIENLNDMPEIEPIAKLKFVSEAHKFGINQSHSFWQYVKDVNYIQTDVDDNSSGLLDLLKYDESSIPKSIQSTGT